MRTSYSALQVLKQCPQKFKFQVIDRIRAPQSKEAIFGTAVHDALAFMFSHDPLFPTVDEVCNLFSQVWNETATKIHPELDSALAKTYEESGRALIKNFYKKNPPWLLPVVDTESRFEITLPDLQTGQTHVVAGIIDRIDKIEDGVYEIIDYKTARKLPSQDAVDHDLQLSLYHMAILRRWPYLKTLNIKLSLYFLKHGEKITTMRTPQDLEHTKHHVLSNIVDIEKRGIDNNFPPTPSALCDYCSYRNICPAWKHLYKKEAPSVDEEQLQKALKEYFAIKDIDDKNAKRLKELQDVVSAYMNAHGVERVFDNDGYFIARRLQQRFIYDFDKIREIMFSAGLQKEWGSILEADDKKLKAILNQLPSHIRDQIAAQKKLSKEFMTLVASSKPVKK